MKANHYFQSNHCFNTTTGICTGMVEIEDADGVCWEDRGHHHLAGVLGGQWRKQHRGQLYSRGMFRLDSLSQEVQVVFDFLSNPQ
ncbi:hypothetical protein Taro_003360, partial [Colocasia esculenta]|nr:hypothetical protein [Colocasia esculenta]